MNSPDATEVKYTPKYLEQQWFIAYHLILLDCIYCNKTPKTYAITIIYCYLTCSYMR